MKTFENNRAEFKATNGELKSFFFAFQLSRKVIFEVDFYRLGSNKHKNFHTRAEEFNRDKTDYDRCGQCQDDVTFGIAKKFYEKWDKLHGGNLTEENYMNILNDIEELKSKYNYLEEWTEESDRGFSFREKKELSMQKLKASI